MKLYIATCTLNFNNIFTTSSISPLDVYHRRGFGNKRFVPVEANNLNDAIILYSKYPFFKVENNDIENYPMVIEIESDDYCEGMFLRCDIKHEVDIFVCSKTIYLNPFHSKVYFRNYEELQSCISKAEQSLETKFSKLYARNLIVKPEPNITFWDKTIGLFSNKDNLDFKWDNSYISNIPKELSVNVEEDIRIDRIRGFLYCYLIGSNLSVPPEVGRLKALARRMKNTLSAIVNSPNHKPTNKQDDSLTRDINEFTELYEKMDENFSYNNAIIASRLDNDPSGLSRKEIENLLDRLGVYKQFISNLPLKSVYDAYELWTCVEEYSTESYDRAILRLQSAVRKCEISILNKKSKAFISELIAVNQAKEISICDTSFQTNFYQKLIRSQMSDRYLALKEEMGITDTPLALAFNGGKILKDIMKSNWEGSPVSKYINDFLSHLQESSAFDICSYDNDVLVSFAAFCQKGNDIDRLIDYLVQLGFTNYKLAYGIFGATYGFAALPKTFTSTLINGDRDYYNHFIKDVYSMIFNIDLKCTYSVQDQGVPTSMAVENELSKTILENIDYIEPKPKLQKKVVSAVSNALELEDAKQNPRAFMYIADNVLSRTKIFKALVESNFENDENIYTEESFRDKIYSIIENSLPHERKAKKALIEKVNKIIELEARRHDPEAFLCILDNLIDKQSKTYSKIARLISLKRPNVEIPKKKEQQINLTNCKIRFSYKYIDSISSIIQRLNPELSDYANKQIRNDLNWVFDPKYSFGKSESELLELFRSTLISGKTEKVSRNGKDMSWKNDAYAPLDIEKTIQALRECL